MQIHEEQPSYVTELAQTLTFGKLIHTMDSYLGWEGFDSESIPYFLI